MQIGSLTWDTTSKHYYYTGVDGVVLYVANNSNWYSDPIAWNGVTAINESPSGAESNKIYADNLEYLNLISKEEFGLTLECYQAPKEFAPCDGCVSLETKPSVTVHGQPRKSFCLIYRVQKGSDTVEAGGQLEAGNGKGYVYHVVYGCKAAPSSRDNATVNESPEAQTLSFEITTTPTTNLSSTFTNAGIKEVAHLEIDGSKLTTAQETALIGQLYKNSGNMPTPEQIRDAID